VAAEHQYLAAYNSAIAFLSECKGTLLKDDNIIVAEPPDRAEGQHSVARTRDDDAQQASFKPAAKEPRNPTFLELWQASTCPSLNPSFLALPENGCCADGTPGTKD
jgi:hypothetical protein